MIQGQGGEEYVVKNLNFLIDDILFTNFVSVIIMDVNYCQSNLEIEINLYFKFATLDLPA